jgi:7-keto-8-aminopelargonate synthetase-like enzyme
MNTVLSHLPGRTTEINGAEHLFFSGYSYLGLGAVKAFTDKVKEGIDRYGVVYPSSRISNTPLDLYGSMEEALARFTHTNAAAVFSSGFLSARTSVETAGQYMNVYCRESTHPASSHLAGVRKVPINQSWDSFLAERRAAGEFQFAWAADSINPTYGLIHDFRYLATTPPEFSLLFIVDDSHGIGWLGTNGGGIAADLELPPHVTLLLNFSLSKSFHVNGGAVCGNSLWIGRVKQHVNFASSTPFMPALAYAWLHSETILEQQRLRLLQNINSLQKLTTNFTFVKNEGTPVFLVELAGIAPYLLQNHVLISSFSYPHPENIPENRIVVNALHEPHDLEKLALLLRSYETETA